MKCPTCGENTPDAWGSFLTRGMQPYVEGPAAHNRTVWLEWMKCANPTCKELVIRIQEGYMVDSEEVQVTTTYRVRPRFSTRTVPDEVEEPFRSDYLEAAAILDVSPRMSAVMSRRVLADVLEKYANQSQFSLKDRIDKFTEDTTHPSQLRENLHHLREIADFGAHTQKDDQAEIVDVGRDEAEWTLDLLDRLFDYFIVGPEKDKQMRASMDAKLKAAGRKEIKPATEGEG